MIEQSNAELIAEARAQASQPMIGKSQWRELDKAILMIRRLAERLEAADQRAELAEADLSVEESKNAGYRAKNNQLAAVVEKVRGSIPLENPELIEAGYTVPAEDLIDYLATAPTDALSEHDAKVRAEALREAARVFAEGEWADAYIAGQVNDDVSAVQATDRWLSKRAEWIEREAGLK